MIVTCFNQVYPIFRCDLEGTKILGIKEIIDEDRLPFLMHAIRSATKKGNRIRKPIISIAFPPVKTKNIDTISLLLSL